MMITEKPSIEEMSKLMDEYGPPVLTERLVHLDDIEYENDYPECKGEAVIRIIKDDKIVGVKHRGGKNYVLPQGRVWEDEKFDEGVKREAYEETGFEVNITSFKEIRRLQIKFNNEILERWYLLFEAEILEGRGEPQDTDEVEDVDFFKDVPWKHELY